MPNGPPNRFAMPGLGSEQQTVTRAPQDATIEVEFNWPEMHSHTVVVTVRREGSETTDTIEIELNEHGHGDVYWNMPESWITDEGPPAFILLQHENSADHSIQILGPGGT